MTTRTITKRNGDTYTVLLDDADAAFYDERSWHMSGDYAATSVTEDGVQTIKRLHRLLMNDPIGAQVDHRNGNKLDNRRENLRVCTSSQNHHNARIASHNTSGYKGVSRNASNGKWTGRIKVRGKTIWAGTNHDTSLAAALARDRAALLHHGEFARLNFPDGLVLTS